MHIFAHVPGRWSWAPALLLGACGAGAPPQLPAQAPTPRTAVAAASPATPAALRDRTLGTTGYACVDCHGLGEPGHRPGPDLAGVSARTGLWSGTAETLPVAVNRCVERWLARPSLDAGALGGVVAALAALPAGASAPSASGARPTRPTRPNCPRATRSEGRRCTTPPAAIVTRAARRARCGGAPGPGRR
jgi:hypothetical protein